MVMSTLMKDREKLKYFLSCVLQAVHNHICDCTEEGNERDDIFEDSFIELERITKKKYRKLWDEVLLEFIAENDNLNN